MDNEKFTISLDGVRRLEYAVNYVLHNISSLNDVCGDMCGHLCNLDGTENERLNALKFVRDSGKFRALIYSMGDMIDDMTVLLEAVIGELYGEESEVKENEFEQKGN